MTPWSLNVKILVSKDVHQSFDSNLLLEWPKASKGAPNESSKYQKDQYLRCWGSSLNGPLHNNPRSYQPYQYLLIKVF